MGKVFFTADLHFGHKNILIHHPKRIDVFGLDVNDENWLLKHDQWIIDMWNGVVGKKDDVFIIGDLSFRNKIETEKILNKLNGNKHIIFGNHDESSIKIEHLFKTKSDLKAINLKQNVHRFLRENLNLVLSHYAMLVWDKKYYGAINVHGHSHGKLDMFNDESKELRVDVGLDGKLANYGLVSLKQLNNHLLTITGGSYMREYIEQQRSLCVINEF